MKVLICAIAKNENRYIREWVEYYKNLGVSKIVLYDNNDVTGETFNPVIGDYMKSGFVEVVDYRGKHKSFTKKYAESSKDHGVQQDAYEECYHKYSDDYDWFGFFDIDEFLFIRDNKTLFEMLSNPALDKVDVIQFNWVCFGDNGHLRYEDIPVRERFLTHSKYQSEHVKSMVRGGFEEISLPCHLAVVKGATYAYPDGKPTKCDFKQPIRIEGAYIEHYLTKTIEEWCDRKFNTTSATGKDYFNTNIASRIAIFFQHNASTPEKRKIVEEKKKELLNKKPTAAPVDKKKVIVSLTSYPERFGNLIRVFDSIYANTMLPWKIVLTLQTADVAEMPKELVDYIANHKEIEILQYEENLKCHLKYFLAMQKYREYPIITIDDDVLYTKDLISSLYMAYINNPPCIFARRVHLMTYGTSGNLRKYDYWVGECKTVTQPSMDLFATGVGGVLYPPNILKISDGNLEGIRKCLNADDIYMKYLENMYKIPVMWVKNSFVHGRRKIVENQKHALSKKNVLSKRNDEYIKVFLCNKKSEVSKTQGSTEKKYVPKEVPETKNRPKPLKRPMKPPVRTSGLTSTGSGRKVALIRR